MTTLYTFASQTGPIPLSELDFNFSAPITLGTTDVALGGTYTTLAGVTLTNPTFTTPTLGTPASGTLTNCTGYSAANITGTLNVANGGTGQTTANAAFNSLAPSQTGNVGKYLTTDGTNTSWATTPPGTVTSVSWTGGIVSVATSTTTPAFTIAGISGGIPYFSSGTTWASSSVLNANALMIGGGAGVAPSTVTTGTGVVAALGVNTESAGAFVVNGGGLGTPSSGTVTNLTGTASININGTVGATTPNTGAFTTLAATSTVDTSALARASGLSSNTTVFNTTTYISAGITLASQTVTTNTTWRIRAYGQFTATNSATVRTARIACFWGSTQLVSITPTVLASTAQTTQWQVEFELVGTSTTAIWTTGSLMSRIASATALAIDNATSASTTVTAGAQTLDLRLSMSASVAGDSWVIQQVTMERLK